MSICAVNKCTEDASIVMVKPCVGFNLSFKVCEKHAAGIASKEEKIGSHIILSDQETITDQAAEIRRLKKELAVANRALELMSEKLIDYSYADIIIHNGKPREGAIDIKKEYAWHIKNKYTAQAESEINEKGEG